MINNQAREMLIRNEQYIYIYITNHYIITHIYAIGELVVSNGR